MKKPKFSRKRNMVYPEEEIGQPEIDYQSEALNPKKLVQAYLSLE
jgi:hypothetical protein